MKCEHCGGNLSIEAQYCPHCGQPNTQASQHIKDMERYKNKFQRTQKTVYTKAQLFTGIAVRVVIIAVLVILTGACWWLYENTYFIKRDIKEASANRNFDSYSATMEEYLEQGNYWELAFFCEEKGIDGYDSPYEEYVPIINASWSYRNVCQQLMQIVSGNENSLNLSATVSQLAHTMETFYEYTDLSYYSYWDNVETPRNLEAMAGMRASMESLLQTHCHMTEEEAQGLKDMTQTQRAFLIEQKILAE